MCYVSIVAAYSIGEFFSALTFSVATNYTCYNTCYSSMVKWGNFGNLTLDMNLTTPRCLLLETPNKFFKLPYLTIHKDNDL